MIMTATKFFDWHWRVVAMLLAVGLLTSHRVEAQWAVHDDAANSTLSQIKGDTGVLSKETPGIHSDTTAINNVLGQVGQDEGSGTINGYLHSINERLKIGTYDPKKPGDRVKDPQQALPQDSTVLDNGVKCDKVAEPQQATCKKIVAIENAQYQYMLTMYANTATRYKTLQDLMEERKSIDANDPNQFGKLEDNTNKLTALYNLLAIDQQQMQTANYAYEANLRYLRAQQTLAAKSAATGEDLTKGGVISLPGIGDVDVGAVLSGIAAGEALKVALDEVKSTTPTGIRRLGISDGKSYGL